MLYLYCEENESKQKEAGLFKKMRVKGPKFYTIDRTCQASTIPSDKFKFAEKI